MSSMRGENCKYVVKSITASGSVTKRNFAYSHEALLHCQRTGDSIVEETCEVTNTLKRCGAAGLRGLSGRKKTKKRKARKSTRRR